MRFPIIYVLFLLLSGLACNTARPEITGIRQFKVHKLNVLKQELTVRFTPVVMNPNQFELQVRKAESEIYFDQFHLGNAESRQPIRLPAGEESEFEVEHRLRISKLAPKIKEWFGQDSIQVIIDGVYTFGLGSGDLKIPYKHETYIYPKDDLQKLLRPF